MGPRRSDVEAGARGCWMARRLRVSTSALFAGVLLVATACGDDGGGDEGDGGDTTITWWHNSNNEPGKGYYEQVGQGLRGRPPGRRRRDQRHGARGHGRQAGGGVPERRRPGHLHGARRRRARRPRRGGPDPRPLRRRRRGDRQDRRLGRRLAGRRQDLRAAVLAGRRGRSGTTRTCFDQAGIDGAADDDGRVLRRHRPAQGRPASPRSRSAPATSGRPRTTGTTPRCAPAPRTSSRTR